MTGFAFCTDFVFDIFAVTHIRRFMALITLNTGMLSAQFKSSGIMVEFYSFPALKFVTSFTVSAAILIKLPVMYIGMAARANYR